MDETPSIIRAKSTPIGAYAPPQPSCLIANYCGRHLIISVRYGARRSSAKLAAAAMAVASASAAFFRTFAVRSIAQDNRRTHGAINPLVPELFYGLPSKYMYVSHFMGL